MSRKFDSLYRESIESPDRFWGREAERIFWKRQPDRVFDGSKSPFNRWFTGGETNLCYNAVDRWALGDRRGQAAVIWVSPETGRSRVLTYYQLYREVNRFAEVLRRRGLKKGDRVIIYLPNIPEALIAMLAVVRLGAIHSVVFGGFAPENLAQRIDDAGATLAITCDASSRGGRPLPIKPLLDKALDASDAGSVKTVIVLDRGLLDPGAWEKRGIDLDWKEEMDRTPFQPSEPAWLEANEPSYILYTSGTTGKPKGVLRDTGGHAVALATSMDYIYDVHHGDVYFSTSDIGWVVGHSYIVYGPLLAGVPTVLFEGTPVHPRPTIWWEVVETYGVTCMFSAPTAFRVLKGHGEEPFQAFDLSTLKYLFLAGEPLDKPTQAWASAVMPGIQILDHYWQTETGWSMIANCAGVELMPVKPGSPTRAVYGYDLDVVDASAQPVADGVKGYLVAKSPLPPGTLQTIWNDDDRFLNSYFRGFLDQGDLYKTGDWAIRDAEGYFWVLGRADEVINIAGHRLGTGEVEAAIASHPKVAEASAVGVSDELKGQAVIAFVVLTANVEPGPGVHDELVKAVAEKIGPIAKPRNLYFVSKLPKTRSGKIMRRIIKAAAEGKREYGNISTLEDPGAIDEIVAALEKREDNLETA